YSKLTFGHKLRVRFEKLDNGLVDDLSNRQPGYSFVTDQRNDLEQYSTHLLDFIFSRPELKEHFLDFRYDPPMWRADAIHAWLCDYARFHGQLLLSTELNTGGPARGTELTALLFANTRECTNRGVFIFGDKLGYLSQYSKTTSKTGQKRFIPHAFDAV